MKSRIHIDFETFSELNLGGSKSVGVHAYTEHASTEMLCMAFAVDDGPVELWLPNVDYQMQALVRAALPKVKIYWRDCPIPSPGEVEYAAWNAEFERTVGNSHVGQDVGFPKTRAMDWVCTAAKSAACGLPRGLGDACEELETRHRKNETGRGIMLQLAKPRKGKKGPRWRIEDVPEKYVQLYAYCKDDVQAERAADEAMPDLTRNERYVYNLDQKINDQGVCVDVASVNNALSLIDLYKEQLDERAEKICGLRLTQTEKLAIWIRENGFPQLVDLRAETIRDTLRGAYGHVPKECRLLLRLRRAHAMKATSKLQSMLRCKSSDDRLRGMFLYHGAGTGRWAGQLVQLQNIARGLLKDPDVAIRLFAHQCLELVQMIFAEAPMEVFASTIRGMLIPSPGRRFLIADYNAIEARTIAWLAGQEDVLEVFRGHGMIYEHTAAKMFHPERVDDLEFLRRMDDDLPQSRFMGKIATLALGFQGAVGALQRMARKFGVELEEQEALDIVLSWRRENAKIVKLWSNLRDHSIAAVENPGQIYRTNRIHFRKHGDYLFMRLPSGRRVHYYKPLVMDGERGREVTYRGIDTYTRQRKRVRTYGGRIAENSTQAAARDLLVNGMINLHRAGYDLVLHSHDETVADMPHGKGSIEEVTKLICRQPKWAEGLPLEATGVECDRYRKD